MNYDNQELTEQLARRYVIGLMRGSARIRFRSLIQSSSSINRQVIYWEGQLNHLTDRLQPVNPSCGTRSTGAYSAATNEVSIYGIGLVRLVLPQQSC